MLLEKGLVTPNFDISLAPRLPIEINTNSGKTFCSAKNIKTTLYLRTCECLCIVRVPWAQLWLVSIIPGQKYSGIRFQIQLKRKLSYHLVQTYVPSTLFVIVSWLSFLVPPESVPGRMAICMTTLLTLTAMFSAVRWAKTKLCAIQGYQIKIKFVLSLQAKYSEGELH